ncbi:MAG: IS630 family transposase [Verrucomicrobiota bacterium]
MARRSKRPPLILTEEESTALGRIARSRSESLRRVQRARILLGYAGKKSFTEIATKEGVTRDSVYKWVDRALAIGPMAALNDKYHRPHEPTITPEAKAWVIALACTKPKEIGYAAELWTLSALAEHVRIMAPKDGHDCLSKAAKASIWRILNEQEIKPHKIQYYLERKDPEFQRKQEKVLIVYREVNMLNARKFDPFKEAGVVTISVDEKPGIQAVKAIAAELPLVPGKHQGVGRDYEYERMGTLSLLAGIDLHSGHIHARVEERHRSREFIGLLRDLDEYYPADCRIRIILDNHSSHISKETMAWLETRPCRFEYVHTPKHGSWLNIIETVFSKMARTFLRGIRVNDKPELKERILLGINEINQQPVVHTWRGFDLD